MSSASQRVPDPLRSTWAQIAKKELADWTNDVKYKCYKIFLWIPLYLKNKKQTNLIGLHGDDGAQSEDEGVDIFHVQVIRGHGVWHRVSG